MTIKIDQTGLPAGTTGQSRTDGLDNGALVTLTNTGGGTTLFRLLDVPLGDTTAESSLAATAPGAATWTFTPTAGVYGTYRVELVRDAGLSSEVRETPRLLRVRTPNRGLIIPALNELADPRATLINQGSDVIARSEDNADDYDSAAKNARRYAGWWRALAEWILELDGLAGGPPVVNIDPKQGVIAVADTNVATLIGLGTTVDDVDLDTDGMRVLLTAQSTATQNGIWIVHAGAWTRPTDFDSGDDAAGAFLFAERGTSYADTGWLCTSDSPNAVIDSNTLTWLQFTSIVSVAGLANVGGGAEIFRDESPAGTFNLRTVTGVDGVQAAVDGNNVQVDGFDLLPRDGDRAMTGNLQMGAQFIRNRNFERVTSAVSTNTDNWNPSDNADVVRANVTATVSITGMVAPTATGTRQKRIINVGTNPVTLTHDATSTAANRWLCPEDTSVILSPGESAVAWYDPDSIRWRIIALALREQIPSTQEAASFEWVYVGTGAGNPGAGNFAVNGGNLLLADSTSDTGDQSATILDILATGGYAYLEQIGTPTVNQFMSLATAADQTTHVQSALTLITNNGPLNVGQTYRISFQRPSSTGDTFERILVFAFDTGTGGTDPGDGEFAYNNADVTQDGEFVFDDLNSNGLNVAGFMPEPGGLLWVHNEDWTVWRLYTIEDVVYETGFTRVAVTHVRGTGSFSGGTDYYLEVDQTGAEFATVFEGYEAMTGSAVTLISLAESAFPGGGALADEEKIIFHLEVHASGTGQLACQHFWFAVQKFNSESTYILGVVRLGASGYHLREIATESEGVVVKEVSANGTTVDVGPIQLIPYSGGSTGIESNVNLGVDPDVTVEISGGNTLLVRATDTDTSANWAYAHLKPFVRINPNTHTVQRFPTAEKRTTTTYSP